MPSPKATAAARLAAMTGPLGGTSRVVPAGAAKAALTGAATPLLGAAGGSGSASPFSDVLSQQLGIGMGGAGDPLASLMGLSGAAPGGTSAAGGGDFPMSAALASPQIAKALAKASAAVGVAKPAPATAKAQKAVEWAKSMVGRQDWNNLCERFVEEAYGTRGIYPTAKDAGNVIVKHRGLSNLASAPPGALLYFAADETNQGAGHAAIYLGKGQMISARPDGVKIESVDSPYNRERYVGWGEAPSRFPGVAGKKKALVAGAAGVASAVQEAVKQTALTGSVVPPRLSVAGR